MPGTFKVAPPRMTILSDHPSRSAAHSPDLLALEGRLASVFDILRHRNTECPVTVAIYGDWGTGKTSAMRWLETQLCAWNKLPKKDREGHSLVHPVWFDPWRYHTREDVWRGIIAEVVLSLFKVKAIKRENFLPQLRLAAKRFGAFLGRGFLHALANIDVEVGAGPVGGKAKVSGEVFRDIYDEWDRTTKPEKAFLNQFEDTLKTWLADFFPCETREDGSRHFHERLVLFIDDLDRSLPAVTLEVLEAIKLYLNLEPLMFVVGLDREVVDAVVTKHYIDAGLGQEKARLYLNKLFQVEIQVPASDEQVAGYSKSLVHRLNKDTGDYWQLNLGDEGTSTRDTLDAAILHLAAGNPREVKRLINSALVRGHSAASNSALAKTEDEKKTRFGQGVAFYLLQRFLRERAFSETLFLKNDSLEWFERASKWRQEHSEADLAIFTEVAEISKSGSSVTPVVSIDVKDLLDSRPATLRLPGFDQCLANKWFWRLLEIPFDAAVGRFAPRVEVRRAAGPVAGPLDLTRLSEELRAKLAEAAGKTLDTLTAADLDGIIELDLDGAKVTDAELQELSRLSALRMLSLDNTQVTDTGLKELSRLSALQELWLNDTQVTDTGLKELSRLSTLQELWLNGTQVTDTGLKELSRLSALQELWLDDTHVTDSGLKELSRLSALKTLSFDNTQVTDAGLKELSRLSALQRLWLRETQVTDAGLKELSGIRTLQALYLDSTQVTDVGLTKLSGLSALQELSLSDTRVTDAGLKELSHFSALRRLWLNDTQVTDIGVKELSLLSSLQMLSLRGTKVTARGLAELKKGLPTLTVYGRD
jgi:Leucine-rich repeat (LRR) protein